VGEFINRFRPGSLVMRLPDSELSDLPTLLFGTCDGALGMLVSLPPPLFEMLLRLQVRESAGSSHLGTMLEVPGVVWCLPPPLCCLSGFPCWYLHLNYT
jgi:hypothetical protein